MSRQVVIGRRQNGEVGLWASPAGVDAMFASDAELLLSISTASEQLIGFGTVVAPATVFLHLTQAPYVLLTTIASQNGDGVTLSNALARPFPYGSAALASFADVFNTHMQIASNNPGQAVNYSVFRRTFY